MRYEKLHFGDILVFKLSGHLKGNPDCYRFLDAARARMEAEDKIIIVDLDGIDRCDSAGVGILASLYTSAENSGASIRFSSIPKRVERLIVLVGLMSVLEVAPTLDEAFHRLKSRAMY